jgi:Ala-tRNA(Pro) deacylase
MNNPKNYICLSESNIEFKVHFTMNGQQKLYQILKEWDITFAYFEHPEAPTIEIASRYWADIEAVHCKNLFFRNHKGDKHYLVIFECHQVLNIHDLEKRLKQGKLSFASDQRLAKYLGLKAGSVSLFGLINDLQKAVHVFIDKKLRNASKISFHPNLNTASLVISHDDFEKFLRNTGNTWEYVDLFD